MAKISFKDNLIILSRSMNMDKDVFNNGFNDVIFANVETLFTQNGWSPISNLHHEPNGDDKVAICLEFTVPQTETTCSTKWLHQTDNLMYAILFSICSIIDHNDDLIREAESFHEVAIENGIILLPAPKEEVKQKLLVYDTGDRIDEFNKIMNTHLEMRTKWPEGYVFRELEKSQMTKLRKQLQAIGVELSIR